MPMLAPMSSSPEPGYLFSRALTSATGQIIKNQLKSVFSRFKKCLNNDLFTGSF